MDFWDKSTGGTHPFHTKSKGTSSPPSLPHYTPVFDSLPLTLWNPETGARQQSSFQLEKKYKHFRTAEKPSNQSSNVKLQPIIIVQEAWTSLYCNALVQHNLMDRISDGIVREAQERLPVRQTKRVIQTTIAKSSVHIRFDTYLST